MAPPSSSHPVRWQDFTLFPVLRGLSFAFWMRHRGVECLFECGLLLVEGCLVIVGPTRFPFLVCVSRRHRCVCPSISCLAGASFNYCSSLFSSPTSVVQIHTDRDELPLTSCSRGPFHSKAILLLPHRRGPPPKHRLCASSVAAHEHQYFPRVSLVPGSVRWPIRLRAC